jgi:hypothetical protein
MKRDSDAQWMNNPFIRELETDEVGFIKMSTVNTDEGHRRYMKQYYDSLSSYDRSLFELYDVIRYGFDFMAGSITDYVHTIHTTFGPKFKEFNDLLLNFDPDSTESQELMTFLNDVFPINMLIAFGEDILPIQRRDEILDGRYKMYKEEVEGKGLYKGFSTDYQVYWRDESGQSIPVYNRGTGMSTLMSRNNMMSFIPTLTLTDIQSLNAYNKAMINPTSPIIYRTKNPHTFGPGEIVSIYGNQFFVANSNNQFEVTLLRNVPQNKVC